MVGNCEESGERETIAEKREAGRIDFCARFPFRCQRTIIQDSSKVIYSPNTYDHTNQSIANDNNR